MGMILNLKNGFELGGPINATVRRGGRVLKSKKVVRVEKRRRHCG
jgi:fructose-specific phosphotransferase system IIC component